MRAREHAAAPDPAGTAAVLRRSGALALATFAALLTLLLPSPAFARPASTTGGAVASTGAGPTSGVPAGRRTHRAEVTRPSRSSGGRTTASAPSSGPTSQARSFAHVAGVSHVGPQLTAALSAAVCTTTAEQAPGGTSHEPACVRAALTGARGSRAPPTV